MQAKPHSKNTAPPEKSEEKSVSFSKNFLKKSLKTHL